jgi:hypothetical protein
MKTLADALVFVVNALQLCSKLDAAAAREASMYCALSDLGKMLRQLPDAELDGLAAAAKRDLEEELAKGENAEAEWVSCCRTWMEDNVDKPWTNDPVWDGNDRIDPVESAIACFRQAEDRNGEMDLLLPHAADPRVFEELRAVIADRQQAPGARMKALRHLEYDTAPAEEADRQRVVRVLLGVVSATTPGDDLDARLVREYAARALYHYADRKEVADVLVPILMDPSQSYDMRRAAFDGLSGAGWQARKPLFEALLQDPMLAEETRIFLLVREGTRAEPGAGADRARD